MAYKKVEKKKTYLQGRSLKEDAVRKFKSGLTQRHLWIDIDLYRRFKEEAKKECRKVSAVMADLMWRYIEERTRAELDCIRPDRDEDGE